jgi:hypothetical protein
MTPKQLRAVKKYYNTGPYLYGSSMFLCEVLTEGQWVVEDLWSTKNSPRHYVYCWVDGSPVAWIRIEND